MERFTIPIFTAKLIVFTSNITSTLKNTLIHSTSSPGPGILSLCHSSGTVNQPLCFYLENEQYLERLNTSHFDRLNTSLSTNQLLYPQLAVPLHQQVGRAATNWWVAGGIRVMSKKRNIHYRVNQFLAPVHHANLRDFILYFFICNHWFNKNPGR